MSGVVLTNSYERASEQPSGKIQLLLVLAQQQQQYLEQQWVLGDALEGLHQKLLHSHHTTLFGLLLLLEKSLDVGILFRFAKQLRNGDLGFETEQLVHAEQIHALEKQRSDMQVVRIRAVGKQGFELYQKLTTDCRDDRNGTQDGIEFGRKRRVCSKRENRTSDAALSRRPTNHHTNIKATTNKQ
jgi:hypothetical protein